MQKRKNSKSAQEKKLINPNQIFEKKSLSYESISIGDFAYLDDFEFDNDFEISEKPASQNKKEESNCGSQGSDGQEPEDSREKQKNSQMNSHKIWAPERTVGKFSSYKLLLEHQSIEHPFDLLELRGYGFLCKYCQNTLKGKQIDLSTRMLTVPTENLARSL
ncbi:hypothetical protein ABPG72_020362 [Tetrahymena utriculariae]